MAKKKYYPTLNEMKEEIGFLKEKKRKSKNILNFLIILTFITSLIIIINVYYIPIYEIKGTSMEPTFKKNDVVAVIKSNKKIKRNDIIAFEYNGKILIKRVIGIEGDIIDIDDEGTVSINDKVLDEPYVTNNQSVVVTQKYPYKVPAGSYFVLSDNRKETFDSRNINIGAISKNQIIGKIKVVVWPINKIKLVEG